MKYKKINWNPIDYPSGLLQDQYFPDRWKIAVICILLNCTKRTQVEKILDKLFFIAPNPLEFINCNESLIKEIIAPLGFKNIRYNRAKSFSEDYIKGNWKYLIECRGIGQYADACDRMYFLGEFGENPPKDHALTNLWHLVMENQHERINNYTNSIKRFNESCEEPN
jgi:methyl-CpG-binding domain protein 4